MAATTSSPRSTAAATNADSEPSRESTSSSRTCAAERATAPTAAKESESAKAGPATHSEPSNGTPSPSHRAVIQAELANFKAANPGKPVGPIAVNQIVHASNARLEHDVKVCVEHKVPIIITSLRAPPKEMIDAVHSYGGIVLHDVINIRHAEKAIEAGVDGLILVAAGAGGHAGTLSPFALVGDGGEGAERARIRPSSCPAWPALPPPPS